MRDAGPCKCGRGVQRYEQSTCRLCHREYNAAWRQKHAVRLARAAEGFSGVYFVQVGAFVKIGVSDDVRSRLRGLMCSCPYDVVPLGFIPDVAEELDDTEDAIHERFKELWHRGEWFRFEPKLRAFIAEHAQPWPAYWPGKDELRFGDREICSP